MNGYIRCLALLQCRLAAAFPLLSCFSSSSIFELFSLNMSSILAWTKAACLLLLASEAFASPIELEKRAVCTAYSMFVLEHVGDQRGF